jgi:hypothetical protein
MYLHKAILIRINGSFLWPINNGFPLGILQERNDIFFLLILFTPMVKYEDIGQREEVLWVIQTSIC